MWLLLNKLDIENIIDVSKVAIESAEKPYELFDKIELFRDVNMIAGGYDPLQDGIYIISKFEFENSQYNSMNYSINSKNYEKIKNKIKKNYLGNIFNTHYYNYLNNHYNSEINKTDENLLAENEWQII